MSNPQQADKIMAFSQFIAIVEGGGLNSDLSDKLKDVIEELNDARLNGTNKPSASIAVTFDFKLDGGVLEVRGDYKVKTPKSPRQRSIFWTTEDGYLSRTNPKQQELPLRQVGDDAGVRSVLGD